MKRGVLRGGALIAAATLAAAACGSSSKSSGSVGAKSPITIGLLTTLTGPASEQFVGNLQGAQARVDLQDAEGGVNGHQIKLDGADDASSFTGAASGFTRLIDVDKAFALIDLSDFTIDAYKVPKRDKVPVVGFPTDGPEWGQPGNTNMVSTEGNTPPSGVGGVVNTVYARVAQMLGAKNMAALAMAQEPASIQGEQSFVKASQTVGLKIGYKNFSIPIGSTNVGPIVLGMKQAGIDGFDSGLLNNTNFAILTGAKQEGLHLVAPILAAGYSQDVLDQPAALQAAQGGIFQVEQRPAEIANAAVKTEQAAFAKYEHYTGVPSLGWSEGWISADLVIKGLEAAGSTPTRATFLSALHNLKGYTADGLLPLPLDLSLADYGKPPAEQCSWFAKLVGKHFQIINNGQPICGHTING